MDPSSPTRNKVTSFDWGTPTVVNIYIDVYVYVYVSISRVTCTFKQFSCGG